MVINQITFAKKGKGSVWIADLFDSDIKNGGMGRF